MTHLAVSWPAIGVMVAMLTWYVIPLVIFAMARRKSDEKVENSAEEPIKKPNCNN